MKYLLLFALALLHFHVGDAQSAATQTAGSNPPNIYALIVGISEYQNKEDINALEFAGKDANEFYKFLTSKAGGSVPAENISLLLNEEATSGAVVNAISGIEKKCEKGDLVYFYFSGHGDIRPGVNENGYLLCWNTPPKEFIGMAFSIHDLNSIANNISAGKGANIVIITDACHSGKLTGAENRGPLLQGLMGKATVEKEVRMVSCAADELSAENIDWGNGRGVFSYYLIKGLKGIADYDKNGVVSVEEIKHYMDSSFKNDQILLRDNHKQTPDIKGPKTFTLAKVEAAVKEAEEEEVKITKMAMRAPSPVAMAPGNDASPQEYFFELLTKISLEEFTNSVYADAIPTEEIPFKMISLVKDSAGSEDGRKKLDDLVQNLKENKDDLTTFKDLIAVAFDNKGQDMINAYLASDETEMEKRRYYNAKVSNYDVYPAMFELAFRLHQQDMYFGPMVAFKQHYFGAVAARLQMPLVKDKKALLDTAWKEIHIALKLEKNAPCIYNELGNLYMIKNDYANAEKSYLEALKGKPEWAVPMSNLSDLYLEKNNMGKAILFADSAKRNQPSLPDIDFNYGNIYEKKGNLLLAEETFRKTIAKNDRHFYPIERLGFVYLNTNRYALADSFFSEAIYRKKGFYFEGLTNTRNQKLPKSSNIMAIDAAFSNTMIVPLFDTTTIRQKDLFGQFAWGLIAYQEKMIAEAEARFRQAISIDKNYSLPFHFLGRLLFDKGAMDEAEMILKRSIELADSTSGYYSNADKKYSLSIHGQDSITCKLINTCNALAYDDHLSEWQKFEDYYLLGSLYERSGYYNKAEIIYLQSLNENKGILNHAFPRDNIASLQYNITAGELIYTKLGALMELQGRYLDAENYFSRSMYSMNAFYKRMTKKFPDNPDWRLKAGNFLYTLARNPSLDFYWDKKIFDPETQAYISIKQYRSFPSLRNFNVLFRENILIFGPYISRLTTEIPIPYTDGINYLSSSLNTRTLDNTEIAAVNSKIGDLYTWQELPKKAQPFYEEAYRADSGNISNMDKLIVCYTINYQLSDAKRLLDTLYNRRQINIPGQLLLSNYYVYEGNFKKATTLLDEAQKKVQDTLHEISSIQTTMDVMMLPTTEIIKSYKKKVAQNGKDSIALYTLARFYAKAGNQKEAWNQLMAAVKNGFNYPNILAYDPYFTDLRKQVKWKKEIIDYFAAKNAGFN